MQKKERVPNAIYERNYVYNFHYPFIWVTKYRKPVFTTETLVQEMKQFLSSLAKEKGILMEEMEVMLGHIHLLISFKPKHAPSDIVKYRKGHRAKRFS